MSEHCCEQMNFHIHEKEKVIKYNNNFREYSLKASDNILQKIDYCPWCGTKLPESLREIFFDTLEQIGIEVNIFELDNIPEEFKTEEWWKNRKL